MAKGNLGEVGDHLSGIGGDFVVIEILRPGSWFRNPTKIRLPATQLSLGIDEGRG